MSDPQASPEQANTYRQILKASSVLASASVINVVVGLVRMKFAALLLGPVGVGRIGLYQNILVIAAALISLGIGTTGTRQIAKAVGGGDPTEVSNARRALFLAALGCSIVGAGVMVALAYPLALWLLGDGGRAHDLALLALGVGLTVLTGYQTAVLTGLHRVGDVARLSVLSGIGSTVCAIVAVLTLGSGAVIAFVLSTPVVAASIGWLLLRRAPASSPATTIDLRRRWRELATLGLAFTISGMALSVGQLAARMLIERDMGSVALGRFQAAWYVSVTYLAFILQAMTTDFYPRLTASLSKPDEAGRIINEQTEVALALSGPVLIGLIGAAPWVMEILYARDFAPSAAVLQWQVLGDLLKIAAWPLGYLLLASGDGRSYLISECTAALVFVASIATGIGEFGLEASGIAVVVMYLFYLPLVRLLARKNLAFAWSSRARRLFVQLAVMMTATFALSRYDRLVGLVAAIMISLIAACIALGQFHDALPRRLRRFALLRS